LPSLHTILEDISAERPNAGVERTSDSTYSLEFAGVPEAKEVTGRRGDG